MAGIGQVRMLAGRIAHGIAWRVRRLPGISHIQHEKDLQERDRLLTTTFPELYRKKAASPVDPKKIIFVENRYLELSDNFQLLIEDLRRDGSYKIHVHFLKEFRVPRKEYNRNCARLAADAATARYIFLNDASNVISCLPIREETTVTQLWHACGAFKRFGYSTLHQKFGPTEKAAKAHPSYGYGNLDYVTVSSPQIIWAYTEAMQLEDKDTQVVPTGISRTDKFYDTEFISSSARKVREYFPASDGKKIILFAPTFRGRVSWATTPDYKTFNLKELQKALGDEYVVMIKQHPFIVPGRTPKIPRNLEGTFAVDATNDLTIDELLCAADIVITDYSSLIFEYSLLDRPMIFYAYDLEDYFDWRGFYYNYDELTPGPVCRKMDEVIDYITHLQERFDPKLLADFRDRFMSSCNGHATERIEELVFGRSLRS